MHSALQDLRFALRQFRKRPAFILTAVLVLALGLGANTAIFSVVNALLLRPLPYRNPDAIAALFERNILNDNQAYNSVSPGAVYEWKRYSRSFEAIAAYETGPITLAESGGGAPPERVDVAAVSRELFAILGVSPAAGRTFSPDEDRYGAPRVAVIAYGLWQQRFGADPGIVGRHIRLDGKDFQVVGVMPRGFAFPNRYVQVWMALGAYISPQQQQRHDTHYLEVIARLKPGVTVEQARADIDAISVHYRETNPGDAVARGANAVRLQDALVRQARPSLLLLLAAVSCVLLIACVNVANLLLARASGRAREIAVRAATGASRSRIVRLLLTESILLSFCGAALGLLLSASVAGALAAHAPQSGAVLGAAGVPLDARVFLFAFGAALAVGIASGLFPALHFSRRDLAQALREGGRSSTQGRAQNRFRGALAAAEVALSLVLLVAAGLLFRSFAQLLRVDPGVRMDHTITVMIPWVSQPRDRELAFFRDLPRRLEAIPGMISAGLTSCLPVDGHCNDNLFYIEGRPSVPGQAMDALQRNADPGYFAAIGMPLVRGRTFTEEDGIGTDPKHPHPGAIVISESLAKTYFPNEDPLGKRIVRGVDKESELRQGFPAPRYQIIGVVGDAPVALDERTAPTFYMPLADKEDYDQIFAVLHTKVEPHSVVAAARAEINRLNPDLAVDRIRTVRDIVGESAAGREFDMVLFAAFAALALALAAFGLYGVLSYAVSERRPEIGVRMALGAKRADVTTLVLRQGMQPVAAGVLAGLPAAAAACRLLKSLLFGVAPGDVLTFILAAVALVVVAAVACCLPALRAARVDPAITLRGQ